jgi:hypothetical protein
MTCNRSKSASSSSTPKRALDRRLIKLTTTRSHSIPQPSTRAVVSVRLARVASWAREEKKASSSSKKRPSGEKRGSIPGAIVVPDSDDDDAVPNARPTTTTMDDDPMEASRDATDAVAAMVRQIRSTHERTPPGWCDAVKTSLLMELREFPGVAFRARDDADDETTTGACHATGCDELGASRCSACRVARYCSPECQKRDWREGHKERCGRLALSKKRVEFDFDVAALVKNARVCDLQARLAMLPIDDAMHEEPGMRAITRYLSQPVDEKMRREAAVKADDAKRVAASGDMMMNERSRRRRVRRRGQRRQPRKLIL